MTALTPYLLTFRKARTTRTATRFYPSIEAARADAAALTSRADGYPKHIVLSVVPCADPRLAAGGA